MNRITASTASRLLPPDERRIEGIAVHFFRRSGDLFGEGTSGTAVHDKSPIGEVARWRGGDLLIK
jgi:hypothetical protein